MNIPALEFLTFIIWILNLNSELAGQPPRRSLNIGFIIDQEAYSMKRAYNDALALAKESSKKNEMIEIQEFLSLTDIANTYLLTTSICRVLKDTVFAIIGAADVQSYDAVESYSKTMQVPMIVYNDVRKIPKEQYNYLLHITPSYIPAIVDFVKYYKWRKIFYIHDESDPIWPWRVSELFSLINESDNFDIVQRHLADPYHCHDQLRHLDQMVLSHSEKIFILDMSNMTVLEIVMKQITELGMTRDGYHFIIGGLDIQSFHMKNFIYGGVRITGFQLVDKNTSWFKSFLGKWEIKNKYEDQVPPLTIKEILLLDSVCFLHAGLNALNRKDPTLFQTRAGKHYNTLKVKEILCNANVPLIKGPIIIKYLKDTTVKCLTGPVSFDKDGFRTNYNLAVHSIGYKRPLHKIGNWSSVKGYTEEVSIRTEQPTRRGPYIVTVVVEPPFVVEVQEKDGRIKYEGYCIDMFRMIANSSRLQIPYVIRARNDNSYGNNKTGVWDGMIGELINGTADIALGSITITELRQAVVDFTKPFMNVGISIMIKRPDKQKPNVFSFKEPFSNRMWICIMFGFAGVSLVIVLVGRFSPYEWHENSTTGPSEDFSVLNSLWSSFGALLQQGSDFLPSSISGRIAECAWWFFTLIIVSSYTANLAAFLTIEKFNIPINSADDLVHQSKIKYGYKSGGSTSDFFKSATSPVFKQMYDFMTLTYPTPHVDNNTEGWKKVLDGKERYAYLVESTVNEYFNQKKPCKTMKVGGNLNSNGYGIATRKDSAISQSLNLALLELRETGVLINLKQKWWYDKGQCGTAGGAKGKQSLSLSNVAGTFHIVIAGLILAMLFSGLEFFYHFRKNKQKKTKIIKTVLITDDDIEESKPLKISNINGSQENRGYQTTSPANLIMFDSITENGQTML